MFDIYPFIVTQRHSHLFLFRHSKENPTAFRIFTVAYPRLFLRFSTPLRIYFNTCNTLLSQRRRIKATSLSRCKKQCNSLHASFLEISKNSLRLKVKRHYVKMTNMRVPSLTGRPRPGILGLFSKPGPMPRQVLGWNVPGFG